MQLRGLDFEAQQKALAPPPSDSPPVQCKLAFDRDVEYLNPVKNEVLAGGAFGAYRATLQQAQDHKAEAEVQAGTPAEGVASFSPTSNIITVAPLAEKDRSDTTTSRFTDRVTAMGHETTHALDHWTKIDGKGLKNDDAATRVHSEWRAFATQTAITKQMLKAGTEEKSISEIERLRAANWGAKSFKKAEKDTPGSMFQTTQSYLARYDTATYGDLDPDKTEKFIKDHSDWMQEALDLHSSKVAAK